MPYEESEEGVGGGPPVPPPPAPRTQEHPEVGTRTSVEAALPELVRLKATGALLLVLAGLMAVLPSLLVEEYVTSTRGLLALGLAATGIAVGVAGLLAPLLRRGAILAGPVLLATAAGVGSPGASLEGIPSSELALAFAFGIAWLLAVEHMHAVMRLSDLGEYVRRQRLTTFRLSAVANHFQAYGAGMVAVIAAVTALVVVGMPWAFARVGGEAFGRSAELNSVFGVALATAIVFTLSALILVFVRSVIPQRVEVERVAYSRERMEEMMASTRVMEGSEPPERR